MRKLSIENKIWHVQIGVLLFLMMWATGSLIAVKALLCVLCIIWGIIRQNGFVSINKRLLIWLTIYLSANVFFMMLSIYNGSSSVGHLIGVRIVEPLLFFSLITVTDESGFSCLKKCFIMYSFFLYIYLIIAFLAINGKLPIAPDRLPFIKTDIGGTLPFGLQKPDAQFIQWLYFLTPMNFALFVKRRELANSSLVKLVICNTALSVIAMILTLKTAMILITFISMMLAYVLDWVLYREGKIGRKEIGALITVSLLCIICLSIPPTNSFLTNTIFQKVRTSFGIADSYTNDLGIADLGSSLRIKQFEGLVRSWTEKPLLGWGDGMNSQYVVRSLVSGSYELVYVAKLMQRGVIGILVYIGLFGWVVYQLIQIIRHKAKMHIEAFSVLIGFAGILIANGTNPYLESFDKLIIIFIPLLVIRYFQMHSAFQVTNISEVSLSSSHW